MAGEDSDPSTNDDDLSAAPPSDDSVEVLLAKVVASPSTFPMFSAGTVVAGRYEVERVLGSGGMGTVYLARDRSLDRPVALKLHKRVAAAERLHREAVAMAKLAHPNVVTVFEVGDVDGRAFVAMEYIRGTNLREWLAARPRSRRDIIGAVCAAGEGLAAAHDAGLVHRDVKPDNILVGEDGRVRIGDFGLARLNDAVPARPVRTPLDARATEAEPGMAPEQRLGPLAIRATETGAVVGTPAYMAPEQMRGEELDARVDQFALCVAAWEALAGVRPFDGRDTDALLRAIERGEPREARRIPAALRRVLVRGLAATRKARWPSLPAMLRRLRAAERRPRVLAIGAASVAVAGVAAAAVAWRSAPADRAACVGVGAEIDALIAPHVDAAVARSSPDDAARIRGRASDVRGRYRDLAEAACTARAREEVPAASPACLQLRALTFRELLVIAAGPELAARPSDALVLAMHAPLPGPCTEPAEGLVARARLDAAEIAVQVGVHAPARRALEGAPPGLRTRLLRASLALADADATAAERELAGLADDARAAGDAAALLAALTREVELAWLRRDRAQVVGRGEGWLVEAHRHAAAEREAAFDLIATLAAAAEDLEENTAALAYADAADKLGVPDELRRLALHEVRVPAYDGARNIPKSEDLAGTLVERSTALFGSRHPRTALAFAIVAVSSIDEQRAQTATSAASDIIHSARADGSLAMARAAHLIGIVLARKNDGRCTLLFERAWRAFAAAYSPEHPIVAEVEIALGRNLMNSNEDARAGELLRHAAAVRERVMGDDHPALVEPLYDLAVIHTRERQPERALAILRRTAAILEKRDPGSEYHVVTMTLIASQLAELGRHADAYTAVSAAFRMRAATSVPVANAAWMRFEAARALIGLGREPARVRRLLAEARDRYTLAGNDQRIREIDELVARLPAPPPGPR